jgi:hypothetical protein
VPLSALLAACGWRSERSDNMTGLELARTQLEQRERGGYLPLNPDRRHEPDGVVNPALAEAQNDAGEAKHASRVSVLTEAQGLVHGDRNCQYGPPAEEYKRTVGMVNAMLAAKLKEPLAPEDLAYIMICLKLSRQINKPKRDSLVDAAGYCEVAQWIIDAR